MVEKCVVFGCSNSRNVEKGISMHQIPSESFWFPFLTSQLRKCQISDASHWLVPNEPTREKFVQARKNLKISVAFSARKIKRIQYFYKKISKMSSSQIWKSTKRKQIEGLGAL